MATGLRQPAADQPTAGPPPTSRPRRLTARRRVAAVAALVLTAVVVLLATNVLIAEFPQFPFHVLTVWAGLFAIAFGVVRRGVLRWLGLGFGVLLLLNVVINLAETQVLVPPLLLGAALLASAAAATALRGEGDWPSAPRPARPVLLWNPRAGDGKAAKVRLADAARERGIRPVELTPGADLAALARAAVADGADALAMAGGDGSQAVVAAVAAEHGLPFACIPSGTRNHFALDLGVD